MMLRDVPHTRQIKGDAPRRWFSDEHRDLIVWLDEGGTPCGFQFCYGAPRAPQAVTWTKERGLRHNAIDDGDDPAGTGKASPVLVAPREPCDFAAVAREFETAAAALEPGLRAFVLGRLRPPARPGSADGSGI